MKIINMPLQNGLQGAINTALNAGKGGGASVIQRYFSEFFSAQSQYLESTSDINITGDYEVKGLVYKASGKAVILFGNKTSFHSRCLINADGSVNFRAGDTDADELTTSSGLVPDNKLSTIYVKRAGTTGTITVNAETPVTGTVTALDAVINTVQRSNTLYGDSRAADLKLWTGNKESGSLIVDLAIDGDGSSGTVINAANESNNFTRVNMTTANTELFFFNVDRWRGTAEIWDYNPITVDGTVARFATIAGGYNVMPADEYLIMNADWVNLTGNFDILVGNGTGHESGEVVSDTDSVEIIFNTYSGKRAVVQEQSLTGTIADSMYVTINRLMEIAE